MAEQNSSKSIENDTRLSQPDKYDGVSSTDTHSSADVGGAGDGLDLESQQNKVKLSAASADLATDDHRQHKEQLFPDTLISNSSNKSHQEHDADENSKLIGWLKMAGLGFRKSGKDVWFVFGDDTGKLYYYRHPQDLVPIGEIDIRNSSFNFDPGNQDKPGLFEIRTPQKVFHLDAADRSKRQFWLGALQKKRRVFSTLRSNQAQDHLMGKGRHAEVDASGLLGKGSSEVVMRNHVDKDNCLVSRESSENVLHKERDFSLNTLRTEIRNTVSKLRSENSGESEEWTVVDHNVPPISFFLPDLTPSRTQWHVEISENQNASPPESTPELPTLRPPRTGSTSSKSSTSSNPVDYTDKLLPSDSKQKHSGSFRAKPSNLSHNSSSQPNPKPSKFMSALKNNMKKINVAIMSPGALSPTASSEVSMCARCRMLGDDLTNVTGDLKATEDELQANREIVGLLQKELSVMRAQLDTRTTIKDGSQEMDVLMQKDKHIIELEHSRAALMEEKAVVSQELRMLQTEQQTNKDQLSMYQQMMTVKDEMIISLTNSNQSLKTSNNNNSPNDVPSVIKVYTEPSMSAVERMELERLKDMCKALEDKSTFLTQEIFELTALRQDDESRIKMLDMKMAEKEAQYYQTRSKYLFLLNEKKSPIRGGDEGKSQDVVTQLLKEALAAEAEPDNSRAHRDTFVSSQGQEYDRFGFLKFGQEEEDLLLSRANVLQRQSIEMEYKIRDNDEVSATAARWEKFMLGVSSSKPLAKSQELKYLVRQGVPHHFRERVWKGCIDIHLTQTKMKLGDNYYKNLEERSHNSKSNPATKQIELDLLRTLPDNRFFEKVDMPGIRKLRKILMCFSVHNPCIGYCQGLNRIAAINLLFLGEEDAFWCLVAIIEYLMPPDYYTNTLAAAQADQRVMKDLVADKLPKLHSHLELNDVDLSLFTFNWFLTIFVDGILPELFIRIWDIFMYEGSKVLFRFALAFLKYAEDDILKQPNALAINRYMRTLGQNITDVRQICHVAFEGLNPFPMRSVNSKRQHHLQQVRIELEELEALRSDFRSNSKGDGDDDYATDDDLDESDHVNEDSQDF